MAFRAAVLALGFLATTSVAAPYEKRGPTYQGKATYAPMDPIGVECGGVYKDTDMVGAFTTQFMGEDSPNCGRTVTITNLGGGDQNNNVAGTITVKAVDECKSCQLGDVRLSPAAFKALTGGALDPPGIVNIAWNFNGNSSAPRFHKL